MRNRAALSLKVIENQLFFLDQTELPARELWCAVNTLEDLVEAICLLKIRGAPLIGVAAVSYLQCEKDKGLGSEELKKRAEILRQTRPTAVNLMNSLDRFLEGVSAEEMWDEDRDLCQMLAEKGAALIEEGDAVLTHCNTGGLATVGVGTALGAIKEAHKQKKNIHVYASETRPLLQGGRLTTWELAKEGVPSTLFCDSMAAVLMAQGKIQKIFVGADRVLKDGSFANKIGTYALALLAQRFSIPFYVVAPKTTYDLTLLEGQEIEIEQRAPYEVLKIIPGLEQSSKKQMIFPQLEVFNPAFDVTPGELVTEHIS